MKDCQVPTLEQLAETLKYFKVFFEVMPYKGVIDYEKMEIVINPVFSQNAEILMHELLHYFHETASEWMVRESAKDIVDNNVSIKNFLDEWIENNVSGWRGNNIFSKIGI